MRICRPTRLCSRGEAARKGWRHVEWFVRSMIRFYNKQYHESVELEPELTEAVLDAVARVEENLAAQRQAAPDNGLAEALVAIGRAVDEARIAASGAIDDLALEETLAPVRKGARVIRDA